VTAAEAASQTLPPPVIGPLSMSLFFCLDERDVLYGNGFLGKTKLNK
jgi:hypothetical protein